MKTKKIRNIALSTITASILIGCGSDGINEVYELTDDKADYTVQVVDDAVVGASVTASECSGYIELNDGYYTLTGCTSRPKAIMASGGFIDFDSNGVQDTNDTSMGFPLILNTNMVNVKELEHYTATPLTTLLASVNSYEELENMKTALGFSSIQDMFKDDNSTRDIQRTLNAYFIEAQENGIDINNFFDFTNDFRSMIKEAYDANKTAGIDAVKNGREKLTDDYTNNKSKYLEKYGVVFSGFVTSHDYKNANGTEDLLKEIGKKLNVDENSLIFSGFVYDSFIEDANITMKDITTDKYLDLNASGNHTTWLLANDIGKFTLDLNKSQILKDNTYMIEASKIENNTSIVLNSILTGPEILSKFKARLNTSDIKDVTITNVTTAKTALLDQKDLLDGNVTAIIEAKKTIEKSDELLKAAAVIKNVIDYNGTIGNANNTFEFIKNIIDDESGKVIVNDTIITAEKLNTIQNVIEKDKTLNDQLTSTTYEAPILKATDINDKVINFKRDDKTNPTKLYLFNNNTYKLKSKNDENKLYQEVGTWNVQSGELVLDPSNSSENITVTLPDLTKTIAPKVTDGEVTITAVLRGSYDNWFFTLNNINSIDYAIDTPPFIKFTTDNIKNKTFFKLSQSGNEYDVIELKYNSNTWNVDENGSLVVNNTDTYTINESFVNRLITNNGTLYFNEIDAQANKYIKSYDNNDTIETLSSEEFSVRAEASSASDYSKIIESETLAINNSIAIGAKTSMAITENKGDSYRQTGIMSVSYTLPSCLESNDNGKLFVRTLIQQGRVSYKISLQESNGNIIDLGTKPTTILEDNTFKISYDIISLLKDNTIVIGVSNSLNEYYKYKELKDLWKNYSQLQYYKYPTAIENVKFIATLDEQDSYKTEGKINTPVELTISKAEKINGNDATNNYEGGQYSICKTGDTTPPKLNSSTQTFTTTVGMALTFPTVTSDDNSEVISSGTVNFNVAGTYTKTYTATDESGNSTTITHTYVVNPASAQTYDYTIFNTNWNKTDKDDRYTYNGNTIIDNGSTLTLTTSRQEDAESRTEVTTYFDTKVEKVSATINLSETSTTYNRAQIRAATEITVSSEFYNTLFTPDTTVSSEQNLTARFVIQLKGKGIWAYLNLEDENGNEKGVNIGEIYYNDSSSDIIGKDIELSIDKYNDFIILSAKNNQLTTQDIYFNANSFIEQAFDIENAVTSSSKIKKVIIRTIIDDDNAHADSLEQNTTITAGDTVSAIIKNFNSELLVTRNNTFGNASLDDTTLYNVWYGLGEDSNGTQIDNVAVAQEITFGTNGKLTVNGLLNSSDNATNIPYIVVDDKIITGENGEYTQYISGSLSEGCIQTHYMINGDKGYNGGTKDNTDIYFTTQTAAMNYASTLSSEATCPNPLNGTAIYDVYFDTDAQRYYIDKYDFTSNNTVTMSDIAGYTSGTPGSYPGTYTFDNNVVSFDFGSEGSYVIDIGSNTVTFTENNQTITEPVNLFDTMVDAQNFIASKTADVADAKVMVGTLRGIVESMYMEDNVTGEGTGGLIVTQDNLHMDKIDSVIDGIENDLNTTIENISLLTDNFSTKVDNDLNTTLETISARLEDISLNIDSQIENNNTTITYDGISFDVTYNTEGDVDSINATNQRLNGTGYDLNISNLDFNFTESTVDTNGSATITLNAVANINAAQTTFDGDLNINGNMLIPANDEELLATDISTLNFNFEGKIVSDSRVLDGNLSLIANGDISAKIQGNLVGKTNEPTINGEITASANQLDLDKTMIRGEEVYGSYINGDANSNGPIAYNNNGNYLWVVSSDGNSTYTLSNGNTVSDNDTNLEYGNESAIKIAFSNGIDINEIAYIDYYDSQPDWDNNASIDTKINIYGSMDGYLKYTTANPSTFTYEWWDTNGTAHTKDVNATILSIERKEKDEAPQSYSFKGSVVDGDINATLEAYYNKPLFDAKKEEYIVKNLSISTSSATLSANEIKYTKELVLENMIHHEMDYYTVEQNTNESLNIINLNGTVTDVDNKTLTLNINGNINANIDHKEYGQYGWVHNYDENLVNETSDLNVTYNYAGTNISGNIHSDVTGLEVDDENASAPLTRGNTIFSGNIDSNITGFVPFNIELNHNFTPEGSNQKSEVLSMNITYGEDINYSINGKFFQEYINNGGIWEEANETIELSDSNDVVSKDTGLDINIIYLKNKNGTELGTINLDTDHVEYNDNTTDSLF